MLVAQHLAWHVLIFNTQLPTNNTANTNTLPQSRAMSERIPNGQVQALAFFEAAHVVETTLVRNMNSDAPVYTNDEEVEVVTQSDAGTQGHVLHNALQLECGIRPVG